MINFIEETLKFLLLHRSNNSSNQTFCDSVSDIVQSYYTEIIVGDFNIETYESEQANLVRVISSYDMVVNDATHISGSLLDLVFVRKCILQETDVKCTILVRFFFRSLFSKSHFSN